MKCCYCGFSVNKGTLFRINEKGVPGIWSHEQCMKKQDPNIPEDVYQITSIIESNKSKSH